MDQLEPIVYAIADLNPIQQLTQKRFTLKMLAIDQIFEGGLELKQLAELPLGLIDQAS